MKILIVEDEEKLAVYIKRALEEEKYTTEIISDGVEALQLIKNFSSEIDLILLDIFLPHLSGLDIAKKVRKENITIPIIMLTAKDKEQEKVVGLDSGADDYITKPFSLQELLARIRSHIRRASGEITTILKSGEIEVNTVSRKVYLKGREVKLTLKEYNILHLLMTHANEVLDREYILEKVWDMNLTSFSNVVDVQVKNLRKKLCDINPQKKIIESIRGIGFRFNQETK